jgi:hypothetical protein
VVSHANPRYFTVTSGDGAGSAVYLTGSHIWSNFHDGMGPASEWFGVEARETLQGDGVSVDATSALPFTSPGSGGPIVLVLRRV